MPLYRASRRLILRRRVTAAAGGSAAFTAGSSVAMKDNGFSAGTKTFTGLNGSVDFPSGAVVIVAFGNRDGTAATTPLIGGQAASVVTTAQDTTLKLTFYQATMPSAQNDTFSIANGDAFSGMGVASGYFTNLSSSTRSAAAEIDFGSAGATISLGGSAITVPASGFGLVAVFSSINATTAPTAVTWTNTTAGGGDTFSNLAGTNGATFGASITLAHTITSGSWNPTAAGVTNSWAFGAAMVAAAWS